MIKTHFDAWTQYQNCNVKWKAVLRALTKMNKDPYFYNPTKVWDPSTLLLDAPMFVWWGKGDATLQGQKFWDDLATAFTAMSVSERKDFFKNATPEQFAAR